MKTESLTVIVEMQTDASRTNRLRGILEQMVATARAEDGCELYELYEMSESPGHFVFYERWSDQKSLDAHMATEHFKHDADAIVAMATVPVRVARLDRLV